VSGIISADGTSFVKESFSAFGARRSACDWKSAITAGDQALINTVTRHGYTWQTALGNMGLNDMNGRVQDAVTGRFLSADPYITQPDNTQNFNRYSYVLNNPLRYIDPSGLIFTCITISSPGHTELVAGSANQLEEWIGTGSSDATSCFDDGRPTPGPSPGLQPVPMPSLPPIQPLPGSIFTLSTAAQGKQPSRACQLAASLGETPDAVNQTADMVGNAVAAEDAALKGLENLGPQLAPDLRAGGAVLGQLAGSASAKIVGPAGYVIGGAQVAYNTYQGNYGDAAFGSTDIGIEATLSVLGGPLGVGVALAWGGVGGSKAVTRAAAIAVCAAGF